MVRKLTGVLRLLITLPLVLLMLGASDAAWSADPPGRAGRVSVIDGDLALRREDSRQWESAAVNWPVAEGDELATESGNRAEVRIGSSVLRLAEDTSVEVRRLDDERIRVRLIEGSVAVRVRSPDREAAIEVETRDGTAVPSEPGQYRVDYVESGTFVTNYKGHIDFRTDGRHVSVTEGRRARIIADGRSDLVWDTPDDDDFSDWSLARDERDDRRARKQYVSPEMTGAEDLYDHGDWRDYNDYGPVWFPRSMPYGWAPYRYGRWVSVAPWGWTWVDDAPWGFAPFHYGRWIQISGSWGWVPGRYTARPVYAPALVAWIGTPGANITFSAGTLPNVSWFPLAPREVYVPVYRHSPTYVRQINVTHITNVVEIDRVVRAPHQAQHLFRDRREAITRVSEQVIRPPRPVTIDLERRREHRAAQWERRGFRVSDDPQRDGGRDRPDRNRQRDGEAAQVPAVGAGARVRPPEPVQGFQRGEREESFRQKAREATGQQAPDQQERRTFRDQRQEPQERQQQLRERDEQVRRQGVDAQDQERRREGAFRQQPEQQREPAVRPRQRDEMEQRQQQERSDAMRQQQVREREERVRQQEQRQQEQRQQEQRQQEQRQQEQRQQEQRQQEQRQQEQRQQEQRQQERAEAGRQEQERRQAAFRQQADQQQREQARQQQRMEAEQRQREQALQQQQFQQRQAEQAQARERQREAQQREAPQREAQPQQERRKGGDEEDARNRRRPPYGQQQEFGRPGN